MPLVSVHYGTQAEHAQTDPNLQDIQADHAYMLLEGIR